MKVEPMRKYCLGQESHWGFESLRPVRGESAGLRRNRKASVSCSTRPLKFEELADWIGKAARKWTTLKAASKGLSPARLG